MCHADTAIVRDWRVKGHTKKIPPQHDDIQKVYSVNRPGERECVCQQTQCSIIHCIQPRPQATPSF